MALTCKQRQTQRHWLFKSRGNRLAWRSPAERAAGVARPAPGARVWRCGLVWLLPFSEFLGNASRRCGSKVRRCCAELRALLAGRVTWPRDEVEFDGKGASLPLLSLPDASRRHARRALLPARPLPWPLFSRPATGRGGPISHKVSSKLTPFKGLLRNPTKGWARKKNHAKARDWLWGTEVGRGGLPFGRGPRAGQVARCSESSGNSRTAASRCGDVGHRDSRLPEDVRIRVLLSSASRKEGRGGGLVPQLLAPLSYFCGPSWSLCPGRRPGAFGEEPAPGWFGEGGLGWSYARAPFGRCVPGGQPAGARGPPGGWAADPKASVAPADTCRFLALPDLGPVHLSWAPLSLSQRPGRHPKPCPISEFWSWNSSALFRTEMLEPAGLGDWGWTDWRWGWLKRVPWVPK